MSRVVLVLCLPLVLLATACGSRETEASWLERFLVENHVTPADVVCVKGDDGYDYVCTFRSGGRRWKQGFLISGHRVTGGGSPSLVTEQLPAGPRPELQRRPHLLRLLEAICTRTPRRFSREQAAEIYRSSRLVPVALLAEFTAFAAAFSHVVDERQAMRDVAASSAPRRVVLDAARTERAARAQLRVSARRLGVDCG